MKKGFTLIELLIVVAIIAILAAIAVPNFLEAQTRSKVARQLTNMRTVHTALESYAVDNNNYVTWTQPGRAAPAGVAAFTGTRQWKFYPGYEGHSAGLTTPISYISGTAAMEDIFRQAHNFNDPLAEQIMYLNSDYYTVASSRAAQMRRYGAWVIRSAGPDTYYQNRPGEECDFGLPVGTTPCSGWNRASYDPTNGTMSTGDIYRSQMRPEEAHALQ